MRRRGAATSRAGSPRSRWRRPRCRTTSPNRCVARPVVLVVCVDLRAVAALDKDLDRVGVVAGASVYPLVWNILLAARNEGFGGTITTMAVAEEPALKELLGIPEPYAVAAVVPLGKPVEAAHAAHARRGGRAGPCGALAGRSAAGVASRLSAVARQEACP